MKEKLSNYEIALQNIDILDKYLKNKMRYLEDSDYTEVVKKNMWKNFYNRVWKYEKRINKELGMFNEEDIKGFIKSQYTNSMPLIVFLGSLLNGYEEWALKTGINPTYNPCNNLDFKEFAMIDAQDLRDKYIAIDELLDKWEENKHKEFARYQEFALVLLIRLGLKGKSWNEVKYFKYEDIDFKNNILRVTNRDENNIGDKIIKNIKVSDEVLEIFERANKENEFEIIRGTKKIWEYKNTPYLIKVLPTSSDEIISTSTFRNSIAHFFEIIESNYIPAKNLFKDAELDALQEIKDNSNFGKLETNDFVKVVEYYENAKSINTAATKLKEYYIFVTKDNDIMDSRHIFDENGNRIIKKY
ncbi:phage lytic cycle repressor MrpR family protein (plasmid) [Clostridium perfringens]|nr:hypothetical protein [Clostridium perfringens]